MNEQLRRQLARIVISEHPVPDRPAYVNRPVIEIEAYSAAAKETDELEAADRASVAAAATYLHRILIRTGQHGFEWIARHGRASDASIYADVTGDGIEAITDPYVVVSVYEDQRSEWLPLLAKWVADSKKEIDHP